MGYQLNVITGQLDLVGTSGGGGGSGTVTSVGLSLPSIFNVTTSVVTTSGTLTAVLNTQHANTVFAGPSSGADAIPAFRSLVAGDIPSLPYLSSTLTSSHILVGNGSNLATDVALSGDGTLSNTGVLTINSVGGATSTEIGYLTGATSNIQIQIDAISGSITGTPLTFAGYDVTGKLETIPNYSFNPDAQHDNGLQFSNTIDLAPDPGSDNFYSVNAMHTDIIPTASTALQHPLIFNPSVHIDPNNSGFDIASVHLIDSFSEFSGTGTLGEYTNLNLFFQIDGNGTVTNYNGAIFGVSLESGSTAVNIEGINVGVDAASGSILTNGVVAFSSRGEIATPMVTGGYEGVTINPVLSSSLNYMSAFNNQTDFTPTSTVSGGIIAFQDSSTFEAGASAQNYTSYATFNHVSGTLNGYTAFQASPSLNGGLGFTSMFQVNPQLQASYANTGSYQAFVDNTQMQTGSSVQNYTSFTSNPSFSGSITNEYTALDIDPQNPNAPTSSMTGVNINFSQFTTTPYLPQGININNGIIQQNATLDTQYVTPDSVYGLNGIGGQLHVSSGFPINAGQFGFGNNLGVGLFAEDDILVDATGADLGFSSVGFVTQVDIAANKTVHMFNLMTAGAGIAGGSGNITNANMFRALGFLPQGGTVNVTNLIGFNADPLLDAVGATNLWGIYIGASTADNFFKKNVIIGGVTGKATGPYVLDATGAIKTDTAVVIEDSGAGTNSITVQSPTLAASYALTLPVDTGTNGYVLETNGSGVTAWVPQSNNEIVDLFTLTPTDITNGFVALTTIPFTAIDTILLVKNAPNQFYGDDYTVTTNQLSWTGLGLDGILASGDKLTVIYN